MSVRFARSSNGRDHGIDALGMKALLMIGEWVEHAERAHIGRLNGAPVVLSGCLGFV